MGLSQTHRRFEEGLWRISCGFQVNAGGWLVFGRHGSMEIARGWLRAVSLAFAGLWPA